MTLRNFVNSIIVSLQNCFNIICDENHLLYFILYDIHSKRNPSIHNRFGVNLEIPYGTHISQSTLVREVHGAPLGILLPLS